MFASLLITATSAGAVRAGPLFEFPANERQLFLLHGHGTTSEVGVRRVMHTPQKKGAVIRPTIDPTTGLVTGTPQIRSAPIWLSAEKRWKLLVMAQGVDRQGRTLPPRWHTSPDGLQWAFEAEVSAEAVAAVPGISLYSVVLDSSDIRAPYKAPIPDLPPYTAGGGMAESPDGLVWKKVDGAALRIPSYDEQNFAFQHGRFIYTVKRFATYGRAVALITTTQFDAANWTDLGIVLAADAIDQELGLKEIAARLADPTFNQPACRLPVRERADAAAFASCDNSTRCPKDDPTSCFNVDVYNMGAFRYESVYIGIPAYYHAVGPDHPPGSATSRVGWNTDGFHLLKLATSTDLRNWTVLGNRSTWLGPSRVDSGAFDLTEILPPSSAIVMNEELWFYYTGIKYRAGPYLYAPNHPEDLDQGAICLATLRIDGFVSLDGGSVVDGEAPGVVKTKPFRAPAAQLWVNVDARRSNSSVVVRILVSGSVRATSLAITGDAPRLSPTWRNGSDVSALTDGKTVLQLEFTLDGAKLYSYWLGDGRRPCDWPGC